MNKDRELDYGDRGPINGPNSKLDLDEIRMLVNKEVDSELSAAILKHGLQKDVSLEKQLGYVTEEYLEVVRDINDGKYDNCKVEITQTMAMLIKLYWLIHNRELS